MVGNTRTRSDIKREAIIQAATQAFQEFGVNGTSMDKLAELANVSKAHCVQSLFNKRRAGDAFGYAAVANGYFKYK